MSVCVCKCLHVCVFICVGDVCMFVFVCVRVCLCVIYLFVVCGSSGSQVNSVIVFLVCLIFKMFTFQPEILFVAALFFNVCM